jgi:hypothetical protein
MGTGEGGRAGVLPDLEPDVKLNGAQQLKLLATLRGKTKMGLLCWELKLFKRRYRIKYTSKRKPKNLCNSLYLQSRSKSWRSNLDRKRERKRPRVRLGLK